MIKTPIEWVRNPDGTQGYSFNPISGCLNGCPYCYARRLANGRLKTRYLANKNLSPDGFQYYHFASQMAFADPFYPRFWQSKVDKLHDRNRSMVDRGRVPVERGIFVCDMSDLFGIGIPEDWTREVLSAIEGNMNHDCFYLLTKQPQNLVKWSPFDKNCCVGVTVTSQEFLSDALRGLISIDAKVKYLSCEPLQGPLSVSFFDGEIQWAIIGAQTKPYKPPKIEWVVEIVEACDRVNIPVFLKNNLLPLLTKCGECAGACGEQIKIADILLDDDGNMRQEYPSGQG